MKYLAVSSSTRGNIPVSRPLLNRIKNTVLGKEYQLSVAFVSAAKIREKNRIYRSADEATDILSFPLGERSGEILMCPSEIRRGACAFRRTAENFTHFLFIHGLLHLKGYRHGGRMEKLEVKFRKKFGV